MLVTVSECGRGVNKDLLPSELAPGVWSDSLNVRFRNGFAEKRKGVEAAFTTPTAVPYWLHTFSTATARFLVQASTASVFVDDGSTRTDITGAAPTGARDDRWTGGDFNGVFVMNNGVDDPMYWNGDTATNLATIGGWTAGTRADTLRPYRDFLVAGAVTIGGTKFPYRLMWSNVAEPGALPTAWTPAATNEAGDKDLAGFGHIVDMLPLGDVLIVYCQEGRYAVQYIGGVEVFSFNKMPDRNGLLARGCVAQTPKGHVFLSNGDVMLHNGGEAISIADPIRRWLTSTMDTTNTARSFVVLNPQESEVWVVFPQTGETDCNRVAAWNWKENTWAIFSVSGVTYGTAGLISSGLAGSWAADTETWAQDVTTWDQDPYASNQSRLILATSTPQIGLANTGALDFGSTISWHLEKTGIPMSDDGDSVKPISRMRPRLDAVSGTQLTVKLATTMNPDDTPTFANSSTYTQGTSTWANQFTNAGRYGAVRIEGADDQAASLRSYQLEVPESRARF